MQERHLPAIQPLTARSVVLTVLLGYHPPALPMRALIRVGGLFGMPERTVRMAVRRAVADGDLAADDGVYRLRQRLVDRQARQDGVFGPGTRTWRGTWEMAVVTAPPRPLAERIALRKTMVSLRLAELREGMWLRPANLVRERPGPAVDQCTFFEARPEGDPVALAQSLWDLEAWAGEARQLLEEISLVTDLREGFVAVAEVYRHLLLDPLLPSELLPDGWPGAELRLRHGEFVAGYADQLRGYIEA